MNKTTEHIKEYMNKVEWEKICEDNCGYVVEIIMNRFGISESRATKIAFEMFREREAEN